MHKEVMKITENVENPEKHIKHNGDIEIKADVSGGATVEVSGSIYVENVAGSQLIAGGKIHISNNACSFKSNEPVIYSKGNVYVKNASNANIAAEGEVEVENVENSTIYSNKNILIRNSASSSKIVALKNVEIGSTESDAGNSYIESGRSAIIDDKVASCFKEKKTLLSRRENVLKYIPLTDESSKKKKLENKADEIRNLINQLEYDINELVEYSGNNAVCGIKIYGKAAKGSEIMMKSSRITLDKNLYYVHFTESDGKIKIDTL